MPNVIEINRRFTYQPQTEITKPMFERINAEMLVLAHHLDNVLPEGREKALALTALQEAKMWSNAAIATAPTLATNEPPR